MIRNSTHLNYHEIFFDRKPSTALPGGSKKRRRWAREQAPAAAPRGANRVADQPFAIIDIPDVHLLVLADIRCIAQVLIDRARALVM